MNAAHLHLLLNHVPVIGTAITIFVLLTGIFKKSDDVKKVSILILILTALITIPVYVSGGSAEEMIEGNYEDVDETYIDQHEDFALYSFIAMDIAGAAGLLAIFLFRKPKVLPGSFAYIMLVILFIVFGMMAYTANLGGRIHHPEIRSDKMPWESANMQSNSSKESKDNQSKGEKEKDKENEDDED